MRIGHAHLKVRDLERAIGFYTRCLGLKITERVGMQYAFLSGTARHHELALQAVHRDAPAPRPSGTGLYHVAFEVETDQELADAYQRLISAGVRVTAVDYGISHALSFSDPDDNGLEIYRDTRRDPEGTALWNGVRRPLLSPNAPVDLVE